MAENEEEDGFSATSMEEPLLPEPKKSCCNITVEPILCAIFFCNSFTGSVTVDFIEKRMCETNLESQNYTCNEPFSSKVESLVQPPTAHMLMYMSLIQAIFPSMLSFFIGPWSDTNGRKPFLIISLTGYFFYYTSWCILTVIPDLPVYYFLIPSSMVAMSGGLVALFTCVNSYIGDVSTIENRAFRFTMVTSSFMTGVMAGYLISAKVVSLNGEASYIVIFSVASTICFLTLIYTIFLVPETIKRRPEERDHFFNCDHAAKMLGVVFEKRPGRGREIIIMMALILLLMIIIIEGEISVRFLVLKKAFSWTLEEFNLFAAGSTLVCVVTSVVGISILRRLLGIPDMIICLIAALVWLVSGVLLAMSKTPLQFCLFTVPGTLASLIGPTLRSEMSKIVPRSDLGKVFAFDSALESLSPYAASPLYTLVYTAVLNKMPLAVYFLTSLMSVFIILLSAAILTIQYYCGKPYYSVIEEEERSTNVINENIERER